MIIYHIDKKAADRKAAYREIHSNIATCSSSAYIK